MTDKIYVDATEYQRDCWRMSRAIQKSGWQPEILLALWRGGAAAGVAIHEFYKASGTPLKHMPLKCHSYTGIGQSETEVKFDCADEVFANLAKGTKVLVVDDVFDTGRTAAAMRERLTALGCDMRMACVYWKPKKNLTPYKPDFYVHICDDWIVFPHEIEGLTPEEIRAKDPLLADLLNS